MSRPSGGLTGHQTITAILFLGILSLGACASESSGQSVERPGDRGYLCDDGRLAVLRQTDPSEIALDLGDHRLFLRRGADGTYSSGANILVMTGAGATLKTPPSAPTSCRSYNPHEALPPPGTP
ncbi:hypothetical protein [Arboricoccus pini]|nr:hypothetical protein [Arboricoccus pini]